MLGIKQKPYAMTTQDGRRRTATTQNTEAGPTARQIIHITTMNIPLSTKGRVGVGKGKVVVGKGCRWCGGVS